MSDIVEENGNATIHPSPMKAEQVPILHCSGCGENYLANQIEGAFHDHWTAEDEL